MVCWVIGYNKNQELEHGYLGKNYHSKNELEVYSEMEVYTELRMKILSEEQ